MVAPLMAMAAMKAVGSIAGGILSYQESRTKAAYERRRAGIARDQAAGEARLRGRQNIRARGREMAAMAQSGFTTGGNFLELLEQSDVDREMDILNTIYQGELSAWGFETQAKMDVAAGKNALIGGIIGAAGSLGQAFIGGGSPASALGGGGGGGGYSSGGMINPSGTGPI
jgi:hypothetical protein